MADKVTPILNGINPTVAGTAYSNVYATDSERDFTVMCLLPTTTGAGTDTLIISIEESDQQDFADPERIRACLLTAPDGTTASAFTTIVGGTSSPDPTLQQKWNLKDTNYNRYLRVKYVIANTATSFTDVTVLMLANERI